MARPITWRNIAGPNFNNSALGQGIDAFRSAGAGFSDLTDQLRKTQDDLDEDATNEAIRRSLEIGEFDPQANPRANSAAVWEALLGKQAAESDLATAKSQRENIASQIGLRDEQTSDLSYKNSPEYRALMERSTNAQITADEAQANYNQWKLNFDRDESERAKTIRTQHQDLERQLVGITQKAYDSYLADNVADGETPTAEQETQARIFAQEAGEDPATRQLLERYALERGYHPEAWDLSTWGERDALRDQTLSDLAGKRAERAELRSEAGLNRELAESNGDFTYTGFRDGRRVSLTPEEQKREKMGSYDDALTKISAQGINIDRLIDEKGGSEVRRTIDRARNVFPNASLLAGAIEPYIAADGELDVEGFRDVLQDAGSLAIMDRINQARTDAGLPPIQSEGGSGSGGDVNAQSLGLTVKPVQRKPATANLLRSYKSRVSAAEEAISQLADDKSSDGTVPIGGGVETLRRALARAKTEGTPTQSQLPGLEENLQILENLLRTYQQGASRRAEYDAAAAE